jgi:hypothetical protein
MDSFFAWYGFWGSVNKWTCNKVADLRSGNSWGSGLNLRLQELTIHRATLSGHRLWIITSGSGRCYLCITGRKPIQEDHAFESLDTAKWMAHSLAHWHIEGKRCCDCEGELCWELASAGQTEGEIAALNGVWVGIDGTALAATSG